MRRNIILVVNIDANLIPVINRELGENYQIICAGEQSIRETLRMKETISLILMNPALGKENPCNLLEKIRKKFLHIPIVCIGNALPSSQMVDVFRKGAQDYVLLPLKKGVLKERVASHLDVPKSTTKLHTFLHITIPGILKQLQQNVSIKSFFRAYRDILADHYQEINGINHRLKNKNALSGEDNFFVSERLESDLDVQFLGNFQVKIRGKSIESLPKKPKMLLAYLLFYAPQKIPKEKLMEIFWPESKLEHARASLNAAIYKIRHAFPPNEPSPICHGDDCYFMNPDFEIEKDVDQFLMNWRRARVKEDSRGMVHALDAYRKALELYKGHFIAEFPFESWISIQKEELQIKREKILEKLVLYYREEEDFDQTIIMGDRLLEEDPCIEEIHYILMETYLLLGRRDRALKQFKRCEKALFRAWQCAPSAKTLELYQKIIEDKI